MGNNNFEDEFLSGGELYLGTVQGNNHSNTNVTNDEFLSGGELYLGNVNTTKPSQPKTTQPKPTQHVAQSNARGIDKITEGFKEVGHDIKEGSKQFAKDTYKWSQENIRPFHMSLNFDNLYLLCIFKKRLNL